MAQEGISLLSLLKNENHADILSATKCFYSMWRKEKICKECSLMLRLKMINQKMLWQ